MSFFKTLLDVLFPPRCVFCGAVLKSRGSGVCESCIENLPYVKKSELPKIEFIDDFTSPLKYEASVRESILRYKFDGRNVYATTYAHILADNVRENLGGKFNLITWVPLSSERLSERGYDQAMLIAMATALDLGDVAVETLRKSTHTEPQSSKGGLSERKANISGAYELTDPELVEGKRILLIDDIVTTGATVSECARMLREGGAKEIYCASLAYSVRQ